MNVVTLPIMPGKKIGKILQYQSDAGFDNSMIDLKRLLSEEVMEHREKYQKEMLERGREEDEYLLFLEPEMFHIPLTNYREQTERLGLKHTVARMPSFAKDTEFRSEDDKNALIHIIIEGMKACSDCKYALVELWKRDMGYGEEREENIDFLLRFAETAHELGMKILISNQYAFVQGAYRRCGFSDSHDIKKFLDELNQRTGFGEPLFALNMDIGVCNLLGQNMITFCLDLREYIEAIVLRENNSIDDAFLLPFSTIVKGKPAFDWLQLIRALRSIDFNGEIIYDFHDTQDATSPILHETLFAHAKKISDHLVWHISMEQIIKNSPSRVLFGAGNMCRNYMQNYGDKYPPLFTCDNNKNLWGQTFEGLEIKNPEELKKLPEECAIIICNVYYNEISEQLRQMGLKNPIGRFNDEYLPTSKVKGRYDAVRRRIIV